MALTPRECRALTSLAYAAALRGIHASLKTDMKWARKIPHPVGFTCDCYCWCGKLSCRASYRCFYCL